MLEGLDGPVVVVGHSYGGAVISDGAADVAGVAHLVYLAAIVADEGETMTTIDVGGPSLGLGDADASEVPAAMQLTDDGFLVIDPELAVGAFYADCEPADVEYALDRLSPQSPATFAQPLRAAAWRTVPSTYVVCADDRAVSVQFQRAFGEPHDRSGRDAHQPLAVLQRARGARRPARLDRASLRPMQVSTSTPPASVRAGAAACP